MSNVYNNAVDYGLDVLCIMEEPNLNYEFNMFVVWKKPNYDNEPTGSQILYAVDSGCSCPSPFEDICSVEQLTRVQNTEELRSAIKSWGHADQYEIRRCLSLVRASVGWI